MTRSEFSARYAKLRAFAPRLRILRVLARDIDACKCSTASMRMTWRWPLCSRPVTLPTSGPQRTAFSQLHAPFQLGLAAPGLLAHHQMRFALERLVWRARASASALCPSFFARSRAAIRSRSSISRRACAFLFRRAFSTALFHSRHSSSFCPGLALCFLLGLALAFSSPRALLSPRPPLCFLLGLSFAFSSASRLLSPPPPASSSRFAFALPRAI